MLIFFAIAEVAITLLIGYSYSRRFVPLEPITYILIGSLVIVLGIIGMFKGFIYNDTFLLVSCFLGFISIGLGIIAIGIAIIAWGKSKESYNILLKTMTLQFKEMIDKLRNVRKQLFDDIEQFLSEINNIHTQLEKGGPFLRPSVINEKLLSEELKRLQRHIEFATWDYVTSFRKAKELLDVIDKTEQRTLMRSLLIMIRNILPLSKSEIIINRHVEHLLMACTEALEFEIIDEFKDEIVFAFGNYIGMMYPRHKTFEEYLIGKQRQLKARGLNKTFYKFNVNKD